ncbi:hypothetical protein PF010_g16741 [Phytophthora fragariae]|uniref:Uncharacterized protein n=1 Tax=Phytophthora fragariae TaxID=53985 RepID=A0A6A3JSE4_9STRA|nr:hypothetical protein PF003_g12746 [Phytophthora fragariae]KAE8995044.1 hypothetical protein PF011_g16503 [Phytophthora fragariae]KAE9095346.1 hypothetical protein PF010_g16741 [Phytophthora fragariae]KAE9095422.1 hypothetical protein PF007_g17390 [Phytophthora fragariae]KAE9296941.1 hypothetical protein PF001_g16628 [Phytophthora fragariae]
MSAPSVSEVQVLENVWIPVDPSTRLSARIWLPLSVVTHCHGHSRKVGTLYGGA